MKNKFEIQNRIKNINDEINRRIIKNSQYDRKIISELLKEYRTLKWVLED